MKILFLLLALVGFTSINAQTDKTDSWKITHNNKLRLQASGENEAQNTFTIQAADLKKGGQLFINYTEPQKRKDWKRTLAVFDTKDNELLKYSGSIFKIENARLDSLFTKGIKTIKLYTWALPTDPKLAARIRVRRVHVATIELRG
jgi:hypothetical protein